MIYEFRKYIDIITENSKEDVEFLGEESLINNHLAIAVLGSPASGKTFTVNLIRKLAKDANHGKIASAVDFTSDNNVNLTVDILRSKIQSQKPKDQLLGFFMAYDYIKKLAIKNPQVYGKWFNQIKSTWQKMDDVSDEITTSISPNDSLVFNGSSDSSQVQKIIAGLDDNEVEKIISSLDRYNDYKRVVRWFQNTEQTKAQKERKNIVYDEAGDEPDKIIERFAELRSGTNPYITLAFMIHGPTPVTNLIQNAARMVGGNDGGRDSSGAIMQAWNDIENQFKTYITASEQVKRIKSDPQEITNTFKTMLELNTDDNVQSSGKSIDLFTQILPQDPLPAYNRSIENLKQTKSPNLAIKLFNAILLYFANYLEMTEDSKKTIYELVGNKISDINAVFREALNSGQFNHPLNNLEKIAKKTSNTSNQSPPERKVAESKKKA